MRQAQCSSSAPWLLAIALLTPLMVRWGSGQSLDRTEIEIPNIPGHLTLKCDFHSHTVFSDGLVWPTIRVEEAWREGLDGFALTDHVEYHPHQEDLPFKPNQPYELALEKARQLNIVLLRGAEITRDMPPGHLNAIFLEDVNPLQDPDYRKAVQAAASQNAFVFWNHPDFPGPEGQFVWHPEIESLRSAGLLHGIEVANGQSYYPASHRWCLEKKLTMMGNSDIHNPIGMEYDFSRGEHRTLTLVFAEERTPLSIRKALMDRRTAVYWKNLLIGEEQYLRPIFESSVEILNPNVAIYEDGEALVQIRNRSDLLFELQPISNATGPLNYSGLALHPKKVSLLRVTAQSGARSGEKNVSLPFTAKNLLVEPDQGLKISLNLKVNIAQAKKN